MLLFNHLPCLTKNYRTSIEPLRTYCPMSNRDITSELAEAFAPGILNSLQDFWFSHLADQTHILVPSTKDIDVWFVDKSDEFDDSCRFVPFSTNI